MSVVPVSPVQRSAGIDTSSFVPSATSVTHPTGSFLNMLVDGADATSSRIGQADRLVRQFVLDDSVPVHQVTFAIEQARLSLELMVQVRTKLLEGYQQLMNMQM